MKSLLGILTFIHFYTLSFCQNQSFEILGTIKGTYKSKMYLFFEGDYKQRDSISSEIKNGKFYFKVSAPLPIQARFHLDQQSFIGDVYIDSNRTYIHCANILNISNKGQDTMNILTIFDVKGSQLDRLKSDFEKWIETLEKSDLPKEQKRDAYWSKLSDFIRKNSKSKLSPYLLGKASTLQYSQVKEMKELIDTSLNNSFEIKAVNNLLNQLDKSQNSTTNSPFHDFVLNDTCDHFIDSKVFRGKYTLVIFWASWCKPCRVENPDLNDIYKKYKEKGFEMVGISFDKDSKKWRKAIVTDKISWPQVIDPQAFEGELANYYGLEAIPISFLLDKAGKILNIGLTPKEVGKMMEKLLNFGSNGN